MLYSKKISIPVLTLRDIWNRFFGFSSLLEILVTLGGFLVSHNAQSGQFKDIFDQISATSVLITFILEMHIQIYEPIANTWVI